MWDPQHLNRIGLQDLLQGIALVRLSLRSGLLPSYFPTKNCIRIPLSPFVLHALPIIMAP
jgi:hypothetical protein